MKHLHCPVNGISNQRETQFTQSCFKYLHVRWMKSDCLNWLRSKLRHTYSEVHASICPRHSQQPKVISFHNISQPGSSDRRNTGHQLSCMVFYRCQMAIRFQPGSRYGSPERSTHCNFGKTHSNRQNTCKLTNLTMYSILKKTLHCNANTLHTLHISSFGCVVLLCCTCVAELVKIFL